ncbi:MAG: DUF1343 domain-containing protein [Acidobacteria bacterium]|nr:DUF1343 domain-containing protein [Acidobacteriota bacterium]MCB9378416.1 DUF1343 domain-containing protein [Holophagales bacterium]
MIRSGLDRLLAAPERLAGRRFGLLGHAASLTRDLVPAHLALTAAGHRPDRLFGPEHGYYGVEQDMVPSGDAVDPWTGAEIVSLYGEDEATLLPSPSAFEGLDLLLVDVQDIGTRYYTYAATAFWAVEAARAAGCEVLVLDRPNPLGGEVVEGNLPRPGFASFVGAFRLPVRHGLTLGEIVRLEARRRSWSDLPEVLPVEGWSRAATWRGRETPWIAPSPNMPSYATALLYPGLCLLEATELSEGRGTTRPFLLLGAPGIDPRQLAEALMPLARFGVRPIPTYFRPQFQKHAGSVCGGVELALVDESRVAAFRYGVELLAVIKSVAPRAFEWRSEPYEFVADRPAIDLLAGTDELRLALEGAASLGEWVASWERDEREFRSEREEILLYRGGET